MVAHRSTSVIATEQIFPAEYSIAELLAGSEQLIELLVDADYARLSGSTIRSATTIADVDGQAVTE